MEDNKEIKEAEVVKQTTINDDSIENLVEKGEVENVQD